MPDRERPVLSPEDEERIRAHEQALDELQSEAARYPAEWWDEFERDLRAHRVNFEERVWLPDKGLD